jgi:hypothetical protein
MGFHKRRITQQLIVSQKNHEDLIRMMKADALILDPWSNNFIKSFKSGTEINLATTYLNLIHNPKIEDIQKTLEYFGLDEKKDTFSNLEYCKQLIDSEFSKNG